MDKITFFLGQIWKDVTIYRLLFHWHLKNNLSEISGLTLDIASGGISSYHRFFNKGIKLIHTDNRAGDDVDLLIDFNKKLSFTENTFDTVLVFNALYIAKDVSFTLSEIRRVLKPSGRLLISSPFVANEMPDPDDYRRLTLQGLDTELKKVNLHVLKEIRFGDRWSVATYALEPLWYFRFIKLVVFAIALALDFLIPCKIRRIHPFPLGYFVIASKM